MITRKQLNKIESTLTRLLEGDVYQPVPIEGDGETRRIFKQLEKIRLTILSLGDSEIENAKKNNTAIASVAHDMKTPLAVIMGAVESLKDDMDDMDYLSVIGKKSEEMNKMVLSLVETSQEELHKKSSQKVRINARIFFNDVLNSLTNLSVIKNSKNIKLKIYKTPNVFIRVDEAQIERVLQNLITNAYKYSEEGGTIKIRFTRWGKTLRVHIIDNGIGISKESLSLVFDKFYREDSSRSDTNSSGLGLYIAKEIVEQHGGTITVTSRKGRGTHFIVSLPVEPDLNDTRTFTEKFDDLDLWKKLIFEFLFGWGIASAYRITRYFETRCASTLAGGLLCLALFPFIWIVDFMSIAVYGRIAFLSE